MTSTPDSETLYHACHSGDSVARVNAYQQLGEYLLRVALWRLRTKPELHPHAQECVQEALLAIWQQLEADQGPDTPKRFLNWATSIVIHKIYDELRRLGYMRGSDDGKEEPGAKPATRQLKRVPKQEQESFEQLVDYNDGTTVPRAERIADPAVTDPETNALRRESVVELLLGIRDHPRLSDESKEVLLQGFLAGFTDEELAARLNTLKSNVYVIRSRDLSRLRKDAGFVARLQAYYE